MRNISLFIVVVGLLCGLAPAQTRPISQDLLTHGYEQSAYWIGVVHKSQDASQPGQRTALQIRPMGAADDWKQLPRVSTLVVALSNSGPTLLALLDDGQWLLIDSSSTSTGLPIPGRALAIAGSTQHIWAVSAVPGGLAGLATTPSTRSAATAPAPMPATPTTRPVRLVLMQQERRQWIGVAELPAVSPNQFAVGSMIVMDDQPLVVLRPPDGAVQVMRFSQGAWTSLGTVRPRFAATDTTLLDTPRGLRLWAAEQSGPGAIFAFTNGRWSDPVPLQLEGPPPARAQRAITCAFERLRLVLIRNNKLMEQRYDLENGSPVGALAEIPVASSSSSPLQHSLLQLIVLVLMMLILIAALRRGFANKKDEQDEER